MSHTDNPLFHIEEVAAKALDRKYRGKPIPETFPAAEEQAVIGYSIAISLKRIADTLDGTALGLDITETVFGRKPG